MAGFLEHDGVEWSFCGLMTYGLSVFLQNLNLELLGILGREME